MTVGPRHVRLSGREVVHLHPLRTGPRRSDDLEVRIDGEDLLDDRNDVVFLITLQRKVLEQIIVGTFRVAERVLSAREVVASKGDAGIAHTVSIFRAVGLFEESLTVGGTHLQQVIARRIGECEAKSVHRLISLRRIELEHGGSHRRPFRDFRGASGKVIGSGGVRGEQGGNGLARGRVSPHRSPTNCHRP